uniref:Reverse transcriptase domain-containing protein n=1 Tax=Peronospora matthiolae TaxID=2874970 RepID=A0AAV1TKQ1_9STRA
MRRMMNTVILMMAQLLTADDNEDIPADQSRCIVLSDFRKAYDTVDREFMHEALHLFGFGARFVDLIRRIHQGTPVFFCCERDRVLSCAGAVRYTAGMPAGTPALSDGGEDFKSRIKAGISPPEAADARVVGSTTFFFCLVDDSTLFLEKYEQLPRAIRLVKAFGALSGLHVQPDESKILFLNRSVILKQYEGIAVVPPGDTTRYMGYEIGAVELVNKDWALRIQKIQLRLITATQVATSVENRVLILNSIALPPLLITASVFDIPQWEMHEVNNIYKQFLWAHATTTDRSRHKVNPSLLVTPKNAGGIGLAAMFVAVKTQRTKHALLWLTQTSDRYFTAWRQWAYRGLNQEAAQTISLMLGGRRQASNLTRTSVRELQQTLGEWLAPTPDSADRVVRWVATQSAPLLERAAN